MRAKLVKESLNEEFLPSSLFAIEYQRHIDHAIPNFGEVSLRDVYAPGSEYYDQFDGDPELEAAVKGFFQKLIDEGKGDWGTWSKHAEESEFEYAEDEYFDIENAVLEKGNFVEITPMLFYDEKYKTGYTIEEQGSWATPEYYNWFFAVK